tara:strand:- start:3843 stop:5525 length:1683 start_codon:yes stop_codon:yes gene_type:complete
MALWESRAEEAVRNSLQSWLTWQQSAYCAEMERRLHYMNGAQIVQNPNNIANTRAGGHELVKIWNDSLSGPGWDDVRCMLPEASRNTAVKAVGVPLLQKMIRSLAVVYKAPVKSRKLKFQGSEDETATRILDEIYTSGRHHVAADRFCEWVYLFDTAFQFVQFDERRGTIRYKNLAPFDVFVRAADEDPSDLQHPECLVAIRMAQPQGTTDPHIWQVWHRAEYWYQRDGDGNSYKTVLAEGGEKGRNDNPYFTPDGTSSYQNKYGRGHFIKPILVQHSVETEEIYYAGDDLKVVMNQRMDRMFTAVGTTMEWQGFAIPVFSSVDREEIADQPLTPMSPIALERDESKFTFERPAAPLGEMMSVMVKIGRMFARLADMDPEEVDPNSKVTSGVSRAQSRIAIQERRDGLVPMWRPYEREVAWLTASIWNAHVDDERQLPNIERYKPPGIDAWEVETVFGNIPVAADPLADAMTKKMLLELGIVSIPELISMDRGISIDAAKTMHEEIVAYNEKYGFAKEKAQTFADIARVGQPGNRPLFEDRDNNSGVVTADGGNQTLPRE